MWRVDGGMWDVRREMWDVESVESGTWVLGKAEITG